jgi:hypothetical protein
VEQHVISLSQQLDYFKEYTSKLAVVAGSSWAQSIVSNSLYIISAGSTDFGLNYINPLLFKTETADQFSARLIGIFNNTVTVSRPNPN